MISSRSIRELYTMIDKGTLDIIALSNPYLTQIDKEDYENIRKYSYPLSVKKGDEIKERALIYIKSGYLKIYTTRDENALLLYTLKEGGKAVINSPHVTGGKLDLTTIAAVDSELIILPEEITDTIDKKYPYFQREMSTLLAKRLSEIISLLSEISYCPLEDRILNYLRKFAIKGEVRATQSEIAKDNATSREVVSRILKKLEKNNKIKKDNGVIRLLLD